MKKDYHFALILEVERRKSSWVSQNRSHLFFLTKMEKSKTANPAFLQKKKKKKQFIVLFYCSSLAVQ